MAKRFILTVLMAVASTLLPSLPALARPTSQATVQQDFVQSARTIHELLHKKQYARIKPFIHPKKGVRFSMYAYVDTKKDKVFSQASFGKYLTHSKVKFTWGDLDGIGEPMVMSLPDYLSGWVVKKQELAHATMTVNEFQGTGNSLNNLSEIYPKHDFVEFYHAGSDDYDGMDWRCLRLVFETYQGRPYLVAVITDEWTI